MGTITYLFPLLIFAGVGYYYWNLHQKGKTVGGGIAAGVQVSQQEKWAEHLDAGEMLRVWGTGVLWRPWWQYELARQIPNDFVNSLRA